MKAILPIFITLFIFSCNGEKKPNEVISSEKSGDSLLCVQHTLKDKTGNCNETENLCCTIDLEYFHFSGAATADSLNAYIHSFFCSSLGYGAASDIKEAWKKITTVFNDQVNKYPDVSVGWNYEGRTTVSFRDENIVSISMSMYSYEGGAHPNTMVGMLTYDLKKNKRLTLKDVFNDIHEITRIGESIFRKEKNIEAGISLQEAGYDFEEFYLSENFMLTENEIIFYYNTYEIAPYVEGPTELSIPYDQISTLLNRELKVLLI